MSTRCALFGMILAALAVSIASSSGFAAERQLKQLSEAEIAQLEEVLPEKATVKPRQPRKLLIFWRCEGFFHDDAIVWSNKALEMIGKKTGAYTPVISADMAMFEPDKLQEFDAVFFNNTSALKFENEAHRKALFEFVHGGKGIVGSHAGHRQDWVDCLLSRKQPNCPIEIGARSVAVCHLGNIMYLHREQLGGNSLKWDPAKWEFVGNDEANRWRDYPYPRREGYELPG